MSPPPPAGLPSVLATILEQKRAEVALARRLAPLPVLREKAHEAPEARGFAAALSAPGRRLVTECKRASPSKGPMASGPWAPAALARAYHEGGAAAISCLTDTRFFWGQLADLVEVRAAMPLPVLRKDFLVDPYQVWESRVAGADAVLLIVAALTGDALGELLGLCEEAGLDALVEVHDEDEALAAVEANARLVGINNRDLRTFEVDLAITERLAPGLAEAGCTVVAESGIFEASDVARLEAAGAGAFLVGESLVRSGDPAAAVRALVEGGES
jgi:indole-3-glycerol phosphate synthase